MPCIALVSQAEALPNATTPTVDDSHNHAADVASTHNRGCDKNDRAMVVETIYVVRHAFRMNYTVNVKTGEYWAAGPSPTGIPTDPVLTAHGLDQAKQLAAHLVDIQPAVDQIYCSPYYRCLQTLLPTTNALFENSSKSASDRRSSKPVSKIKIETGFGEFLGRAWFKHPRPVTLKELDEEYFPNILDTSYDSVAEADEYGETIEQLHDRIAYVLHRVIEAADAEQGGPRTLLICSHAACIIAIGRALTGEMPTDFTEDDFQCYTAGLSTFRRRARKMVQEGGPKVPLWDKVSAETIPHFQWQDGKGVLGGWDCVKNSDCSFLAAGPERGWHFSGDESFLSDPNGYNDAALEAGRVGKGPRL